MTTIDASTKLQGAGKFLVKNGLVVAAMVGATGSATVSGALEVMTGATATVQASATLSFSGTSSLKGALTAEAMGQVEFAGSYKRSLYFFNNFLIIS